MQRKYLPRRNRITAAVLAGAGGVIGAQKFYLRQNRIGFMMFVIMMISQFKLAPIFGIYGIFEAIRFLSMSDEEFDRRYNRYASQNRRDDYLERRRERQMQKNTNRRPTRTRQAQPQTNSRAVSITRAASKAAPFKNSGIKKYKDFDLEGAIEDFSRGLDIHPGDIAIHFNIANAYSLTEQKDKAYYHLQKAVELGFKDFEMIKTKDDLAFVRIQPEWEEFMENGFKVSQGRHRQVNTGNAPKQEIKEEEIKDDVLLSQLNKLAELRKKGLLSSEEFNIERRKLLRR